MFGDHFYNSHIRKLVSVFGTMFNDIRIRKTDANGAIIEENKVPLAYGPKKKFLARIQEQPTLDDTKVAIKLPRMSFEITSIDYDTTTKLNKQNRRVVNHPTDANKRATKFTYSPYNIGMDLNIMVKNQDEGLQIVEQILPYFQPDYTVTILEDPDLKIKNDVPIILNSINLTEEYEGDMMSRHTIIYTLSFTTKIRFYGPRRDKSIIRSTITDINDIESFTLYEKQTITTNPTDATSDGDFTFIETYDFFEDE
jgi:hypothetical protein